MNNTITKVSSIILMIVVFMVSLSGCWFEDAFDAFFYKKTSSQDIYMFENLDELRNMEKSFEKYGQVQSLEAYEDEFLNNLKFENNYLAKYKCEEFEFEIFAYEFEETNLAKKYYFNIEGKQIFEDYNVWRLYLNENGNVSIIALNYSDIYRISYKKTNEKAINELLSKHLSYKIINTENSPYTFELCKTGDGGAS